MTSSKPSSDILDNIIKEPDTKKAYLNLVDAYLKGDEAFRQSVRDGWDFDVQWRFPEIIPPPSICRTEEEQNAVVRAQLLYFSIGENEWFVDYRDALISIAATYHECLSLNINPKDLFYSAAKESTSDANKLLMDFIERSDEDKSMEAFCLVSKVDENGRVVGITCEYW